MNTIVFDVFCILLAIGAAKLAKRQLVIVWTLALHISICNGVALLLAATQLIDDYDPGYFLMLILLSFIASMVLYQYRNDKTLFPYLTFLAFSIMSYFVFFEYFTGSSIFYGSFSFVMSLIITAQIVLIANIGGSIGTIRRYWRVSRHRSVSYGHPHYRVVNTVSQGFQRDAEGDR